MMEIGPNLAEVLISVVVVLGVFILVYLFVRQD